MGCDVGSAVLSAAEPGLLLALASPELSPKLDINGSGRVQTAAKVFADEMGSLLARKKAAACEDSPELVALQVKSGRSCHFLSSLYEYSGLYETCQHISLSVYSLAKRSYLYSTDPVVLFVSWVRPS